MKYISKVAAVIIVMLLLVTGCKRESFESKQGVDAKPVVPTENEVAKIPNHRLSVEQIAMAKQTWLNSIKRPNVAARGGCGEHVSENYILTDAAPNSCGNYDLYYTIWSYDLVGSGYEEIPVSATFTDLSNNALTSTLVSSSADLVDDECKAWEYDGYCDMIREYEYIVHNVPFQSNNPTVAVIGYLDLLSGFSNNCTPITIGGFLPGTLNDPAYYSGSPARAIVNHGGGGTIVIFTDCSTLCNKPFLCPNGGTAVYTYNGGSPQTLTFGPTGAVLLNQPPGSYSFTVTLTYTISGNTFTTPPVVYNFTI